MKKNPQKHKYMIHKIVKELYLLGEQQVTFEMIKY